VEISEGVVMGFWDLQAVVVKVKDFVLRAERTEVERYVRGGIVCLFGTSKECSVFVVG
jgi:hypothetical protein